MVGILRQSASLVTPRMLSLRPLPAFEDNYIWVLSNPANQAVIVDPGEAAPVFAAVAEGLQPIAIVLTHHHPDHVGGVGELLSRFDIPCYAPVDERIAHATQRVREGDRVKIPELALDLQVLEVPGHTLSHIAYVGAGMLFCGDTMFSLGCGRLFEGTPLQMMTSLERMAALPGDTLVCCGHEYTQSNGRFSLAVEPENPARDLRLAEVAALRSRAQPSLPSTIASERACNPFLRIDAPGVRSALEVQAGHALDRVAAFTALRVWKNGFAG